MVTEKSMRLAFQDLRWQADREDGIPAYFRRLGVKGDRHDANFCPVAMWLGRRFAGCRFMVTSDHVTVMDGTTRLAAFSVPECVTKFVDAFDRGDYPDLMVTEEVYPWI